MEDPQTRSPDAANAGDNLRKAEITGEPISNRQRSTQASPPNCAGLRRDMGDGRRDFAAALAFAGCPR